MNEKHPARKRRSSNPLIGIGSGIKVSKEHAAFIEPAAPSPPSPIPMPSFRKRIHPSQFRIQQGSRTSEAKPFPLQPQPLPRPVASRPINQEMSRENFVKSASMGGAAMFAGLLGLGKAKKKK